MTAFNTAPMTFYANPYTFDATGFYFNSDTDMRLFDQHMKAAGVEEVEIEFIDGEDWQAALFSVSRPNQADILEWVEAVETYIETEYDAATAYHRIANNGDRWQDVIGPDLNDHGTAFKGTVREYAEDYIDSTGMLDNVPDVISRYFDYDSFARDLVLGGDVSEFTFAGSDWVFSG
jgi:antirestriction protein